MAVEDILFIAVIVFSLAITFLIFNNVMTTATDQVLSVGAINSSSSAVDAFSSVKTQVNNLDYVIFAFFIGLTLALIITGWLVGSHPVFMIIYFIVVTIAAILSMVLSNAWDTVSSNSAFVANIGYFPITSHILSSLPIYISIIGFIGIIAMFARPREI